MLSQKKEEAWFWTLLPKISCYWCFYGNGKKMNQHGAIGTFRQHNQAFTQVMTIVGFQKYFFFSGFVNK